MYALFLSIILAMFNGEWYLLDQTEALGLTEQELSKLGKAIGSLFTSFNIHTEAINNSRDIYSTLSMWSTAVEESWNQVHPLELIGIVLAFITCIGIIVMAIKGIKKAFGIFFMGVNRL